MPKPNHFEMTLGGSHMGPWGIAALVAVVALSTEQGRSYFRKALKSGVRAGCHAKESVVELADKAKDYTDELVAEIRAESEDEHNDHDGPKSKRKAKATTH
jgi:hypothetical protein